MLGSNELCSLFWYVLRWEEVGLVVGGNALVALGLVAGADVQCWLDGGGVLELYSSSWRIVFLSFSWWSLARLAFNR